MPRCLLCNDTDIIVHAGAGELFETPCLACESERLNVKLALAMYVVCARSPFSNQMLFTVGEALEAAEAPTLRHVVWSSRGVVDLIERRHKAAHRAWHIRHRWTDLWFAFKVTVAVVAIDAAVQAGIFLWAR